MHCLEKVEYFITFTQGKSCERSMQNSFKWRQIEPSQESLARQVQLVTLPGKRPWRRPSSRWRDYISDLAWAHVGVGPTELSAITEKHEVFRALLGMRPVRPFPKKKRVWKCIKGRTSSPIDIQPAITNKKDFIIKHDETYALFPSADVSLKSLWSQE